MIRGEMMAAEMIGQMIDGSVNVVSLFAIERPWRDIAARLRQTTYCSSIRLRLKTIMLPCMTPLLVTNRTCLGEMERRFRRLQSP